MAVIVITGRGKSGSWQIRGEQLGRALGALVTVGDVNGCDLAVVVKRPRLEAVRRIRCPLVWDVVDAWPQPLGNDWDRATCIAWLRGAVAELAPRAIVAATEVMAADCREFRLPVLALPHHARPGQLRNPLRPKVESVGYEGAEHYLGWWREFLEQECARRGWRFVCNPPHLADVDIVVAVRAAEGYAARQWKSNVKLANALGSGTPSVCNRAAGYVETASAGQRWADDAAEMRLAFDVLSDLEARRAQVAGYRPPLLGDVAAKYGEWLRALKF